MYTTKYSEKKKKGETKKCSGESMSVQDQLGIKLKLKKFRK